MTGNAAKWMELDGYTAVIRYNPETDEFRGEVQGINGGADFYGKTPDELRRKIRHFTGGVGTHTVCRLRKSPNT